MLPVLHVRAFKDNYIWIVRGDSADQVAIIDPGDADPVLAFLQAQHLRPAAIICTHHHGDHVGGVAALLDKYSIPVYGPAHERISGVTQPVREGDTVRLAPLNLELRVLDIPGHTAGHVAFVGAGVLFCGDTLFSAGCGRLFEGTAAQMYASLAKLAALPDDTLVYCGHEYTAANLRFALTVEPENTAARAYLTKCQGQRAAHQPTLPSQLALERRVNPFLRTAEATVRRSAEHFSGTGLGSEVAVFAALRRWKDDFYG